MPVGLAREPHAAFGLAHPGFAEPAGVADRGLTQQRNDLLPELQVGVSPAVASSWSEFPAVEGVPHGHHRDRSAQAHSQRERPGTQTVLASVRVDASLAGYRQLLRWAGRYGQRKCVENARGLGRHLAQWLAGRGELVEDVPSTATARIRELSRGGRRKNDTIDAARSRERRRAER